MAGMADMLSQVRASMVATAMPIRAMGDMARAMEATGSQGRAMPRMDQTRQAALASLDEPGQCPRISA